MATQGKVKDPHFREKVIPQLAADWAKHYAEKFSDVLTSYDAARWMTKLMYYKLDLVISHQLHKVVFIPPGTTYNPDYMKAEYAEGGPHRIENGESSEYRVKHCLWPAVYGTPDQSFPDNFETNAKYEDALLRSRHFFFGEGDVDSYGPEIQLRGGSGKYEVQGSAFVVVEKIED